MPPLRDYRRRIRSVGNTRQVTKAMEMVSAAKLRRSQQRVISARPYAKRMREILERVSSATREFSHPFFEIKEKGKSCLVLITSDKGLCGAYNTNVIKRGEEFLKESDPENTVLFLIGKKGFDYFRKRKWKIVGQHTDIGGRLDLRVVKRITDELLHLYLATDIREVRLIYTNFISLLRRRVTLEKFLPISPPGKEIVSGKKEEGASAPDIGGETPGRVHPQQKEETQAALDYIFEPSPEAIFESLLPRHATTRIFMALAEAIASENSSRMVAMSAATKNAEEMIDHLTVMMNRIRQAAITKEISEIVGGAESLR